MSVITDWTPDKAKAFGRETLMFKHALHERPMFDDEGLARLLDQYPRDKLGVFTMGEDPKAWTTWRKGSPGNLSGDQLLDAAKSGRIWLNLRQTNDHVAEYAALSDEIFADKEAHVPGLKTFKRDVGMLISSANAQVFYHLDVPLVSLWQLRGRKKVWVYPVADPYIGDPQLERIVLKETAEQFAYDPSWDAGATFPVQNIGQAQVIDGWNQGLVGLNVGSQVLLVVPPDLGYKDQAQGSIPANSTLVFVVDVLAAA